MRQFARLFSLRDVPVAQPFRRDANLLFRRITARALSDAHFPTHSASAGADQPMSSTARKEHSTFGPSAPIALKLRVLEQIAFPMKQSDVRGPKDCPSRWPFS